MTEEQRQKYHSAICQILNATYDDSIRGEPNGTGGLLALLEAVREEAIRECIDVVEMVWDCGGSVAGAFDAVCAVAKKREPSDV